jgi:hypothetical protein
MPNVKEAFAHLPDMAVKGSVCHYWRSVWAKAVKTFPDELMHIRQFVIQFSTYGIIGQLADGAIPLQGTVADFQHLQ